MMSGARSSGLCGWLCGYGLLCYVVLWYYGSSGSWELGALPLSDPLLPSSTAPATAATATGSPRNGKCFCHDPQPKSSITVRNDSDACNCESQGRTLNPEDDGALRAVVVMGGGLFKGLEGFPQRGPHHFSANYAATVRPFLEEADRIYRTRK